MAIPRRAFLVQLSLGALTRPGMAAVPGPLRVLASPVPHAEILRYVKDHLSPGFELKIVEIYGSVRPNELVAADEAEANYFQHLPYLRSQEQLLGVQFAVAAAVHIEPLGLYSRRVRRLEDLPRGSSVTVPGDATNLSRALYLLQDRGLLRLRPALNDRERQLATPHDISANPLQLRLIQVDGPQLARSIGDVALAVINGNYALEARLNPSREALALEGVAGNPYVNVLVTTPRLSGDPRIIRLAALLHSPELIRFIRERYQGAVIPVGA
jgi:D-methionine transport system substrate-binding protein